MYGKCQCKTLSFCFFHSADSNSTSIRPRFPKASD